VNSGRTDIGSKEEQTAYRRLHQDAHVGYRRIREMMGAGREIRGLDDIRNKNLAKNLWGRAISETR